MVFRTLYGSSRKVKASKKYLIDWEAPSKSKIQAAVKIFLKKYWEHDIVFEEFPLVGSRMTFDFYNATKNIILEVQGKQHTKYVSFFHGNSKINYLKQLKRDQDKFKFCEINEIDFFEYFQGENEIEDLYKILNL